MASISNIVTPRVWDIKRILIALLIAAAIALFFWTQSRIPDLNTKAQMGQRTVVAGLAFDVILPVSADQPVYQRVAFTAVNWSYTNWKGMTFGILFAAAFFVILAYLPRHEFRGQMLNTLKGVVTGVPLGVCVNCTTPIAHGMYQAGVRLDILSTGPLSPTRLFVNQQSENTAISFALRDHQGNRFGIGSKITIHYQEDGEERHQLRELKASGGFMSFNAPRAHFGLGGQAMISRLEIDWSSGGKTIIDETFPAGNHYVVTRE